MVVDTTVSHVEMTAVTPETGAGSGAPVLPPPQPGAPAAVASTSASQTQPPHPGSNPTGGAVPIMTMPPQDDDMEVNHPVDDNVPME